mgnify:CR=1 FL=1
MFLTGTIGESVRTFIYISIRNDWFFRFIRKNYRKVGVYDKYN